MATSAYRKLCKKKGLKDKGLRIQQHVILASVKNDPIRAKEITIKIILDLTKVKDPAPMFPVDGQIMSSTYVDNNNACAPNCRWTSSRLSADEYDEHLSEKWMCGVLANTGSIYCAPYAAEHVLKINTIDDTVETLDDVELPETGQLLWQSGALAADNSIYYMPAFARQIMRLNPDNESLSSVGNDLGDGWDK